MDQARTPRTDQTATMTHPADVIAAAVTGVGGVASLNAGTFGEVGTYLPGRRVPGIRIEGGVVEVHVTLFVDSPVQPTATRIRAAVAAVTADVVVDVYVDDVVSRPAQDADCTGTPAGPTGGAQR